MQIKHLDVLLHMRIETDNPILHFDSIEEVSLTIDAIINVHRVRKLPFRGATAIWWMVKEIMSFNLTCNVVTIFVIPYQGQREDCL